MNITHRIIPQTRVLEIEFNQDDVLKAIKKHQIDNLAELAGHFNCRTNEQQAQVFYNLLTGNQGWFDAAIEAAGIPWIATPFTNDECVSVIEEFPWIFFNDNNAPTGPYLSELPSDPDHLVVKFAYSHNTYKPTLDSVKILSNLGVAKLNAALNR